MLTLQDPSCVNCLFLFTSGPTHGALLEAREVGDASVSWSEPDQEAHHLPGVWTHSFSRWTCREHNQANDLALMIGETSFNGEDNGYDVPEGGPSGNPVDDWVAPIWTNDSWQRLAWSRSANGTLSQRSRVCQACCSTMPPTTL